MNFIKSPLNYTGNKYRILRQIVPYFPAGINTMVDLFCGGATVGINIVCKECYFVDSNPMVIGLLDFLKRQEFDVFLVNVESTIKKYKMSNSYRNTYKFYSSQIIGGNKNNGLKEYNKIGFYRLREDYNKLKNKKSDNAFLLLYILLIYGFNNDLRFNSSGNYNLPIGKTDLNKMNVNKVKEYIERTKELNCSFIVGDFRSEKIKKIINSTDFVYLDPPYLITDAVYNEASGWNKNKEKELMHMLDFFIEKKKKFILSNVLSKKGRINEPLDEWIKKNKEQIKLIDINYHYRSASYNKKQRDSKEREVIICYNGENKYED